MELAHPSCSPLLVSAVERVLPRTTVATVAGADICANTEQSVDAAIKAAPRTAELTEAASQMIEARCGADERVLWFPFDVHVDRRALARSSPRVAELQTMIYRVRDRVFGKSFWFPGKTADEQRDREARGASLVPELKSGKYNSAFEGWECFDQPGKKCVPNYLAWRLGDYRVVPPVERGPKPQLLDADSLHLTTYVAPTYPSIAASARVSGDVQLRLVVDARTGAVTDVEVAKDVPLLRQSAVDAAKRWRFAPEYLDGQPILVAVRFSLDC